MTVLFGSHEFDAISYSYDNMLDRLNMEFLVDDITDLSSVLLTKSNLETITIGDNVYNDYTKLHVFSSLYDTGVCQFRCFVSLETDETIHERLMSRLSLLETARDNILTDVQNLQKVNLDALIEGGFVSDNTANILDPLGIFSSLHDLIHGGNNP